ncbi:hypothetical protein B0H10DRAFT_2219928 [Mycena sp. CBHHK59/15]|nr:hypothetical protein B0H10DRAFT_2234167 [Mycena sp. CBHHK59/15]KAJ6609714.1 hypothetical protein B0H10DRAFT_2225609 [Mycena sp. CBHHK59/15]KAJ6615918.1 hypothetical protein B0H10DRAFT_2219928 [Mycena sp. CBHHK59/15]
MGLRKRIANVLRVMIILGPRESNLHRDPDYFRRADAKRIIDDIRKSGAPYWFVNTEARALALIYRVVAGKDLQLTWGIMDI